MSTKMVQPEPALRAPVPQYPVHDHAGHSVQFYRKDSVLLEELGRFIGPALLAGNSAVVIATQAHREGLVHLLSTRGMVVDKAARKGRYIALDAAETLSKFMVNGVPDAARFKAVVGGILSQAKAAAQTDHGSVAAFGEMVALLWESRKLEAAVQLEELWNAMADTHSFSLCCAYPLSKFDSEEFGEPFTRICAAHTLVIPSDEYTALSNDGQRLRNIADLQRKAAVLDAGISMRHNLAKELATTADADEMLSVILRKAVELIGAEGGCAGLRHPQGLVCNKYLHKGEMLPFQYCFPSGHGLPGWLLRNKIPYLTNDAASDSQIRHELCDIYGVRSALSTPILDASGEVIAFFEVHNKIDGLGFTAEDKRALALVAQIASIALRKALAHTREVALRLSEERFRLLVDAVRDYAIFMLDSEGRISSWNSGAERIKGYKASEIIGQHFSCFYPEEDLKAGKPQRELEIAAEEGRVEDEGWRLRKDGSKFWANVVITALRDNAGNLIGFSKVTKDGTERMLVLKALRESRQELHESENSLRRLSLHLLRTQDEERRRIGRDLHDSLGQSLSVLKMKLDSFASANGSNGHGSRGQNIGECANIAEDCIKEVRTISYLLYPPMLEEMGLKSAISWYLDGFTKRSGIHTTFDILADFGRLPRDAETAIFRVLQESLTNVHRHSGSETAHVRLLNRDGVTILEVSDKGKGLPFQYSNKPRQDGTQVLGVGLRGMAERMRQLGGSLDLTSSPQGTTVIASVPIGMSSAATASSA
jgi:PAS domain S-box-containing protein